MPFRAVASGFQLCIYDPHSPCFVPRLLFDLEELASTQVCLPHVNWFIPLLEWKLVLWLTNSFSTVELFIQVSLWWKSSVYKTDESREPGRGSQPQPFPSKAGPGPLCPISRGVGGGLRYAGLFYLLWESFPKSRKTHDWLNVTNEYFVDNAVILKNREYRHLVTKYKNSDTAAALTKCHLSLQYIFYKPVLWLKHSWFFFIYKLWCLL